MKVGIIGTHWGRTHVGTFRHWGHEIGVLVGRDLGETQRVAREEGIPRATVRPEDLREVDLVVVASPTPMHRAHVEMFLDRPVLCEKPLGILDPQPALLERARLAPVFVNYAFGFLDTARRARALLQDEAVLGQVEQLELRISFRFPPRRSAAEWFLDLASHPLSFLSGLFGPFTVRRFAAAEEPTWVSAVLSSGRQLLRVELVQAPAESLHYELTLLGPGGRMEIRGGYRPELKWSFEPILVNGAARSEGESLDGGDIWYRANVRCVGAFLEVIQGRRPREQALAEGLADVEAAAAIERACTLPGAV